MLKGQPQVRVAVPGPSHLVTAKYTTKLQAIARKAYQMAAKTVIAAVRAQAVAVDHADHSDHADAKKVNPAQVRLPMPIERASNQLDDDVDAYTLTLPTTTIAGTAATATEASVAGTTLRIAKTLGLRAVDPGTELAAARDNWIAENSALIKSIPREVADRVQTKVQTMLKAGSRWETIASHLEQEEGIATRRAATIARDQVSKYNGALNQAHQQAAGIEHYEWRGAMDARERPEHVALQGLVFAWDSPPPIGHPGEPIMCRCVAVPITSAAKIAQPQPEVTEEWLVKRTTELGPKARDVGKSQEKLAELARKSVAEQIRMAANRQAILRK